MKNAIYASTPRPIPEFNMGMVVRLVDNYGSYYDSLKTIQGLVCILNQGDPDCGTYWREFDECRTLEGLCKTRNMTVQYIWRDIFEYTKDVQPRISH